MLMLTLHLPEMPLVFLVRSMDLAHVLNCVYTYFLHFELPSIVATTICMIVITCTSGWNTCIILVHRLQI